MQDKKIKIHSPQLWKNKLKFEILMKEVWAEKYVQPEYQVNST